MKLRNKKTGEIWDIGKVLTNDYPSYDTLEQITEDFEAYKPKEPLIKNEKIRKAVRAWAEAENCSSEMNLYYILNRQEKYITFHNPQTGSELQLCDFDSPVFQEMREYTIDELCGDEE